MPPGILSSPEHVLSYFQKLKGFSLPKIAAISLPAQGRTNLVYRVHLAVSDIAGPHVRNSQFEIQSSIILKHITPYAMDWPDLPFDAERRAYEANALREVQSTRLGNVEVRVPRLLYDDAEASVILMEDVSPLSGIQSSPCVLLSSHFQGDGASCLVGREEWCVEIGEALGSWLYALHQMGMGPDESRLRRLFDGNMDARRKDAWWTYGSVMERLVELNVDISPQEREILNTKLKGKESELVGKNETLIMGDLRSKNILITSNESTVNMTRAPFVLNILDWEFTTYGAAFTDLGHFAAESWVQDRNFASSPKIGSLPRLVTSSLFKRYRQLGGKIDLGELVPYMATHIVSSLLNDRWPWQAWSDEKRRAVAAEALQMLRILDDGDLTRVKNDAFLSAVL